MTELVGNKNETGVRFSSAEVGHCTAAVYGIGSIGTAAFVIVPQLYLLFFMTEVLAIPAAMAGAVLLVPKLWEFVFDPMIGSWSDRLDTRWGRRAPLMTVGAVLFAVSFAFLFGPPIVGNKALQALIMGAIFLVSTSAYALFSVPYITIPSELPEDGPGRVRTVAWRMAFVSIGILLAGVSAPLLVDRFGGGIGGFAAMGLVLAVLSGGTMLVSVFALKHLPGNVSSGHVLGLLAQLRVALANRAFVLLGTTYVLQLVATAIALAMLPFFVKYVLGADESLVTTVFAVFTLASLAALPFTAIAARRWGEARTYRYASLVYAFGQTAILLSAWTGRSDLFVAAMAVVGIGNAGQLLLPFAMLPRTIDLDRKTYGQNREGAFTGFWIAGEKLGLALGGFAAATILGLAGFVEASGTVTGQPASALTAIVWQMSIVPAFLFLASLWPLSKFDNAIAGVTSS